LVPSADLSIREKGEGWEFATLSFLDH
jgi:hypothetical protein